MTSPTGRRPVRRATNDLIDATEELAVGVGRLGYGLLSLGLNLLPRQSRQHMHNAVHELSHAFATLPRDFAEIAGAEVERWAAEGGPASDVPAAPATPSYGGEASASTRGTAGEASVQRIVVSAEPTGVATGYETAVGIAYIEYDPPGRDREGEYVLIANAGTTVADLTGWILRDGGARHNFVFPVFALAPGASVKVWTRPGANDATNLYWGNIGAIWNNSGDSATLSDAAGNLVGSYSYEGTQR